MQNKTTPPFTGKDGLRGVVVSLADTGQSQAEVLAEGGRRIMVPAGLLKRRDDGSFYLPLSLEELEAASQSPAGQAGQAGQAVAGAAGRADGPLVIPLVEERLETGVRRSVTGKLRVSTHVTEREEVADLPLLEEEVEVRRVPVGKVVDGPVPVRQEGDTVIVPVLEEVLVVEKRLMLREEVRLTTRRSQTHRPQRVTLRREEATVERLPGAADEGGQKK